MGARDTEEQLEAALEQAIQDERQIARLERKLDAIRTLCTDSERASAEAQAEHHKRTGYPDRYTALLDVEHVLEILDRKDTP